MASAVERSRGAVAAFLTTMGMATDARGVCDAFVSAQYAADTWVQELQHMAQDGTLTAFVASVRSHPARDGMRLLEGGRGEIEACFACEGALGITLEASSAADTAVYVKAVKASGLAAAPPFSSLTPGLQLTSVNGTPCVGLPYRAIIELIKAAGRPLRLTFLGEVTAEVGMVRAVFRPPGVLGITFASPAAINPRRNPVIKGIRAEGLAALPEHAQLAPGMVLESVQGQPVANRSFQDVLAQVKGSPRPLELVFSGGMVSHAQLQPAAGSPRARATALAASMDAAAAGMITATFTQPGSLGLNFTPHRENGGNGNAQAAVRILGVNPGSQAENHPQLQSGLVLVSVGPTSVAGMAYKQVIDTIKAGGRPLTMVFVASTPDSPGRVATPRASQPQSPARAAPVSPAAPALVSPAASTSYGDVLNSYKIDKPVTLRSMQPSPTEQIYTYTITTHTGDVRWAATDAEVFVTLFGESGESGCTHINHRREKHFERGETDEFTIECSSQLGRLKKLRVGHDGSGRGAGWYLDRVEVSCKDAETEVFECGRWLAEDEGDGKIELDLVPKRTASSAVVPTPTATVGNVSLALQAQEEAEVTAVPSPVTSPPVGSGRVLKLAAAEEAELVVSPRAGDSSIPTPRLSSLAVPSAAGVGTYRVLKVAALRDGTGPAAARIGRLDAGEVVTVSELMVGDDGLTKARTEKGWVSSSNFSGVAVLEALGDTVPVSVTSPEEKTVPAVAPTPEPEPEPEQEQPGDDNEEDELSRLQAELTALESDGPEEILGFVETDPDNEEDGDAAKHADEDANGQAGAAETTSSLPATDPLVLGKYRVKQMLTVREGLELKSEFVQEIDSGPGVSITVLEAVVLDTGVTRVRTDKGWVSLKAVLLEKIDESLLGEYLVKKKTALRKEVELESAESGSLSKGEVIDVKEATTLDDGTIRLRCAAGWVSRKPHRLEQLEEEAVVMPGRRGGAPAAGIAERRASIAVDWINEVVHEAEAAAAELGAVAEMTFDVEQTHLKRVSPRIQMKVGGMGVSLYDGPTPIETYMYQKIGSGKNHLVSWGTNEKSGTVFFKLSSSRLEFKAETQMACEIVELMMQHAKSIRSQQRKNTDDLRKFTARLSSAPMPTIVASTDDGETEENGSPSPPARRVVSYTITTHTGDVRFAGTDANVYVKVFGEAGESETHKLNDKGKNNFERDELEEFTIDSADLGHLYRVRIGHDGSGRGSGWFLNRVEVRPEGGRPEVFECGRWLDKDEDDGKTERDLVLSPEGKAKLRLGKWLAGKGFGLYLEQVRVSLQHVGYPHEQWSGTLEAMSAEDFQMYIDSIVEVSKSLGEYEIISETATARKDVELESEVTHQLTAGAMVNIDAVVTLQPAGVKRGRTAVGWISMKAHIVRRPTSSPRGDAMAESPRPAVVTPTAGEATTTGPGAAPPPPRSPSRSPSPAVRASSNSPTVGERVQSSPAASTSVHSKLSRTESQLAAAQEMLRANHLAAKQAQDSLAHDATRKLAESNRRLVETEQAHQAELAVVRAQKGAQRTPSPDNHIKRVSEFQSQAHPRALASMAPPSPNGSANSSIESPQQLQLQRQLQDTADRLAEAEQQRAAAERQAALSSQALATLPSVLAMHIKGQVNADVSMEVMERIVADVMSSSLASSRAGSPMRPSPSLMAPRTPGSTGSSRVFGMDATPPSRGISGSPLRSPAASVSSAASPVAARLWHQNREKAQDRLRREAAVVANIPIAELSPEAQPAADAMSPPGRNHGRGTSSLTTHSPQPPASSLSPRRRPRVPGGHQVASPKPTGANPLLEFAQAQNPRLSTYMRSLGRVALLTTLNDAERMSLAQMLNTVEYEDGDHIITAGDEVDGMFIVESGTAEAQDAATGTSLKTYAAGDFFGELALVDAAAQRKATVVSTGFSTTMLKLPLEAYEKILDANEGVRAKIAAARASYGIEEASAAAASPSRFSLCTSSRDSSPRSVESASPGGRRLFQCGRAGSPAPSESNTSPAPRVAQQPPPLPGSSVPAVGFASAASLVSSAQRVSSRLRHEMEYAAITVSAGGEKQEHDALLEIFATKASFGAADQAAAGDALARTRAVLMQPELGDGPLTNAAMLRGNIAVVKRGDVTFVNKARRAQEAGAVGVIVINSAEEPFLVQADVKDAGADIAVAVVCVRNSDGESLLQTLGYSNCVVSLMLKATSGAQQGE